MYCRGRQSGMDGSVMSGSSNSPVPAGGDLEAELKYLASVAGLEIPADRLEGMAFGYKDIKEMLVLVRRPRTAAAEPANVYSLETITRSV